MIFFRRFGRLHVVGVSSGELHLLRQNSVRNDYIRCIEKSKLRAGKACFLKYLMHVIGTEQDSFLFV